MTRQSAEPFRLADYRPKSKITYFNRLELNQLLALYSRHVIRGEWRDYAIDHRDGFALFSVFRHACEGPTFTIMKAIGAAHGDYQIFAGRRKLRSGKNLSSVLEIFDRRPKLVGA
jgi:hypothetical protein